MRHAVLLAIFLLTFFCLLSLPLFQLCFQPVPRKSVSGLAVPDRKPRFTTESFINQSFQKRAEDWFLKRHGLWGYLVRASNEFTYRFFGQVSANYSSTVLVGKHDQLYQPMYLNSFNRAQVPALSKIEKRAREIKEFQDLLEQRGVASTLLISTNVLSLYPELIPSTFTDPTHSERQNSYQIMRPLLDRYGVKYVDGDQLLSEQKSEYPFRFFPPTASHWNNVASCLVTRRLLEQLEEQLKKPLAKLYCEPIEFRPGPLLRERDLLAIANLLFPKSTYHPTPYVVPPRETENPVKFKPKMLFVGTSFTFTVLGHIKNHSVSDQYKLYYYYGHVHYSSGKTWWLDKKKIDWQRDVFSQDAIVLEANVAHVESAGFDFISDALAQLRKNGTTPSRVNANLKN